jgi:hypothetical protein
MDPFRKRGGKQREITKYLTLTVTDWQAKSFPRSALSVTGRPSHSHALLSLHHPHPASGRVQFQSHSFAEKEGVLFNLPIITRTTGAKIHRSFSDTFAKAEKQNITRLPPKYPKSNSLLLRSGRYVKGGDIRFPQTFT